MFKFELEEKEVVIILNALNEMPAKVSRELLNKLDNQINEVLKSKEKGE